MPSKVTLYSINCQNSYLIQLAFYHYFYLFRNCLMEKGVPVLQKTYSFNNVFFVLYILWSTVHNVRYRAFARKLTYVPIIQRLHG